VHQADIRGKPREGTDYDVILYGVQDKGLQDSGNPPQSSAASACWRPARATWVTAGRRASISTTSLIPFSAGVERELQRGDRRRNPLGRLHQ